MHSSSRGVEVPAGKLLEWPCPHKLAQSLACMWKLAHCTKTQRRRAIRQNSLNFIRAMEEGGPCSQRCPPAVALDRGAKLFAALRVADQVTGCSAGVADEFGANKQGWTPILLFQNTPAEDITRGGYGGRLQDCRCRTRCPHTCMTEACSQPSQHARRRSRHRAGLW